MNIEIEVQAFVNKELFICNVPIGSPEAMKEAILEAYNDLEFNEGNQADIESVTIDSVINYNDLTGYENLYDLLEELADYDGCNNLDVISAGVDCGVQISDIDEAYAGSFKDRSGFAYDMADQLSLINKEVSWPYTCIDWDYAGKELMYDYSESNGYYFRNF